MGRTVFISYTTSDEHWAKLIGNELEQMGHTVVSMYKGFQGNFISRIKEAYDKCDNIILLFSPDYERSGHCEHEMTVALKMEIEERKGNVHLIKVNPYRMHHFYSVFNYIDLSAYHSNPLLAKSYFREEISKRFGELFFGAKPHTIHNLPYRIPNFTGRKQIIEDLHHLFNSESRENYIQALIGLGGVGKTKISLEYAYRYLSHYQLIWFFHAEDKTTLRQEISDFAKTLQLPEAKQENIDLHIAAFRKYLDEHDKWLIVFDNATSLNDLEGILPALPSGNIIITSRNTQWGSHACILPIEPFSEKESIEYLEKRLHRENERPCFQTVTNDLDRIPIALDIAAAYMDTNQISCEDYRSVLEETDSPLDPLTRVWGPSFSKIKTKSNASISLLEYLTHFSPDNIPEEVLYPALKLTPDLSESLKNKASYLETLSLLLQYSFLSKDLSTRALTMHRIVQKIVRTTMDDEAKKKKAATAVEIFSQLFPIKSDDPETIDRDMWMKCHQMLPHAVYAAEIADGLEASPISTLHLYAQVASFLRELDNLKEAEVFAEKSLAIASRHKESIHHAISLETMARILRDQGRNTEAQALIIEAINIEENLYDSPVNPEKNQLLERYKAHLAVCYDGYGRILSNLGRTQESLSLYNKALSLDMEFYTERQNKIAIRKNNIACAFGQMGKDDLEIQYLKEALQIEEKLYGGNHPHIAIRLGNLALVYERIKDQYIDGRDCIDRAREYWERAFDIDLDFYGLGHPHTLSRMYGLAGNYRKKNDFEKALEWNNKAIDISESEAPEGYNHGEGLLHRGNTYVEMKDYPSALKDYEDALSIITKSRGEKSHDQSIVFKNIAFLKGQQGDYSSAADYLEKALQIDELNNQTQNRGHIVSLMNLGYYYSQSGDDTKAKSYLDHALRISTEIGGKDNPDCSLILKHLAAIEGKQNNFLNAVINLEKALEIDRLHDQEKGKDYCISLLNLGYYYSQLGDPAKAKSKLSQALPLIEKEFGEKSQNYLITLTMLINTKIATKDLNGIQDLIEIYARIKKEFDKR